MDEVREKIYQRVKEFVSLRNQPRHLVFMSFPGSGKTTTVMRAVDEFGLRWIYAAPTHDVIDENIRLSNLRYYDFAHLKSKAKVCLNERAKILFEKGYDASFLCKECGFSNVCEYAKMQKDVRKNLPNIGIVHSHLNTWLPAFLEMKDSVGMPIKDEYDVLIIDENPIQNMFIAEFISYRDLAALRRFMLQIPKYDKSMYAILGYMQMTPIDFEPMYEEIEGIYKGNERKNFIERFGKHLLEEYIDENIRYIPPNKLRLIYDMFDYIGSKEKLERSIVKTRQGINFYYFINDFLSSLNMRVIGLDGTATRELWTRILETDDFDLVVARYYQKNIYQLNNAVLPISTWKRVDDLSPLKPYLDIIEEVAKRRPNSKVLVIATKWIIDNRLISYFADYPNVVFAHYYALRSRNEFYKECDTVILACEPNPPPTTFREAVAVSGWPEELWKRIYTFDEMIQAIGRLRANIRITSEGRVRDEPMTIILTSSGVGSGGTVSTIAPEAIVVDKKVMLDIIKGKEYTGDILLLRRMLSELPIKTKDFADKYGISYYKALKLVKRLQFMGYAEYDARQKRFIRTRKAPPVIGAAKVE